MRQTQVRGRFALMAAIIGPLIITVALIPIRTSIANTDAALIIVAVIVGIAAMGARRAGYIAAVWSALAFDFFLTRPYETFEITRGSDIQTAVLIMVIGGAVTEIAVWGRRQQADADRRAGYLAGVHAAAEAALTGQSRTVVIERVNQQLQELLGLRSCTFQSGIAGLGHPTRLHHDGRVTVAHRTWPVSAEGFPPDRPVELLLESHGVLQGRFLMLPQAESRPSLESRQVAAALADQVSAALTSAIALSKGSRAAMELSRGKRSFQELLAAGATQTRPAVRNRGRRPAARAG